MIVYYHPRYNINLGILNYLHLFDGGKFAKIYKVISRLDEVSIATVKEPVSQAVIDDFVGDLMRRLLSSKRFILQALEIPYIPLLSFAMIDRRILEPMRWAVSGTLEAATLSLEGNNGWNLSGGYHHASKSSAEGFCIYNDIGIAVERLLREQRLAQEDRVLIVDVDAHHGNGNAHIFMENRRISILDIYNDDIYPKGGYTKGRVDINVPLRSGTSGDEYLTRLESALNEIDGRFKLAFVVAGTDVLSSDPLGGLSLSVQDCVARDQLVLEKLKLLSIPAVFLGGGGYGKESANAIIESLSTLSKHKVRPMR